MLSKRAFLNLKSFLLLTLVFGGCFLVFGESLAQNGFDGTEAFKKESSWLDFVGEAFFEAVLAILYGLFKFVWMFFAMAMWLLDVVVSPEMFNQVFFSPTAINGINTAWGFVRDFFNLFFILIVVLIGLSVILGVSKFKDKSMLVKVALAAMLINFSKAITLFFIDMSQVFMRFFAEALGSELTAKFLDLVRFGNLIGSGDFLENNLVYLVTIISVIIMTIVMAVMIFYLAISLIIRMIAFWVLIILSPLAFFGMAMEGTKLGALKDDWVKNLISWCFYGPILLFFIWLALILVATIGSAVQLEATNFSAEAMDSSGKGLGSFVVKLCGMLIPYITAIYLLFYGYDKAKSASTGAATRILSAGSAKISQINNMAKKRGYGASFIAPKTRKGVQEGFKSRFENSPTLKRFTKKGKEDAQNKTTAKWKDRITGEGTENWKGRVVGKGDAMREYNTDKAFEQVKKWKDNPPSNNDLNKAFTGEDEVKKIAATLYKSQNNKFSKNEQGENEYEIAMQKLEEGGYENLKDKITQETKKENLGLVIDYQIKDMVRNRERDEEGNLLSEEQIRQKVFDSNLKGNLSEIFKKQNKALYEQEGVIEYLDRKHADKDSATKRKFAENIKNSEIEEYITSHSFEGVNLLGRS